MSLSYSGIIGAGTGKAVLPSVESWGQNNSILRDPPKSIMTRKIDKISDTSSIIQQCDESGDRICEMISTYARGVNPMVSVSYGNEGNNGVGSGSLVKALGGTTQAYLPYRIIKDGAFRPPIMTPYQLLPLSRQPRITTSQITQPCFVDFSKKLLCPGGPYREVKEKTLKTSVRPTATFKMNSEIIEPFEVKYVIKNPTKFDAHAGISGVRTQDLTTQEVNTPTKGISDHNGLGVNVYTNHGSQDTIKYVDNSHFNTNPYIQDPLHSSVQSKMGSQDTIKYVDNSHFNTNPYIQDPLHSSVQSKMSQSIQVTSIEDLGDRDIRTKNAINISYTPLKTGYTKEDYIHNEFELDRRVLQTEAITNKNNPNIFIRHEIEHQKNPERNMPIHQIETNHGTTFRQKNLDSGSREYNLKPTINPGEYTGRGQIPNPNPHNPDKIDWSGINTSALSEKARRDQLIMNMQEGRY